MSMEGGRRTGIGEMLQQRHGTRMTRIGQIFTDLFNPCVSVSSAQSVFYHKKPQINADERRPIAIIHRKEREERKAEEQKSLRPLRSLRLIEFHGIPTAQGTKEKIVFQTGLTGSTGCVLLFNPVHPVILSRMKKPQMDADMSFLYPLWRLTLNEAPCPPGNRLAQKRTSPAAPPDGQDGFEGA